MKFFNRIFINLFLSLVIGLLTTINVYSEDQSQIESETNSLELNASNDNSDEEALSKTAEKKVPIAVPPPAGQIPISLIKIGEGQYFSEAALILDKTKRTLSIWKSNSDGIPTHVASFPSDHGRKDGDKMVLGDLKTPEGIYIFQKTYTGKQLNYEEYGQRAFTMDYPNYFDKLEKKTGSGIWLHSIPESKTLFRGSRGCVVVRNDVIDYLKKFIVLKKTPIIIHESVSYLEKEAFIKRQKELKIWLTQWKQSWSKKNLDSYMSFYDEKFKSQKMNKEQWRTYKSALNEKYSFINVSITEPVILAHKNELTIHFIQDYESDKNKDFGQKTLYLKYKDGSFKILNEQWQASQPLSDEEINSDSERSLVNSSFDKSPGT